MLKLHPEQIVVVTALDIELPKEFEDREPPPIIVTGMGKINASVGLVEFLMDSEDEIKLVVNLGSVGSHTRKKELVQVKRFSCWDAEFPVLDGSNDEKIVYESAAVIDELCLPWDKVHCATGDKFVTYQKIDADIFDMEAYALAYICHLYNIPLLSVKYISDAGSTKEWIDNIEETQNQLAFAFDAIMGRVIGRSYASHAVRDRR